jgi:hypothetical protein
LTVWLEPDLFAPKGLFPPRDLEAGSLVGCAVVGPSLYAAAIAKATTSAGYCAGVLYVAAMAEATVSAEYFVGVVARLYVCAIGYAGFAAFGFALRSEVSSFSIGFLRPTIDLIPAVVEYGSPRDRASL